MQVIKDLFLIEVQWAAVEMQGDVRQAPGIVGKGALAFAGELNGSFEFVVECCELRN